MRSRLAVLATVLATALLVSGSTIAYETDQYTDRLEELTDSTEILDREVNEALERIAANWRHGDNRGRLATRVYRELGGRHWVDRLERFAIRSPNVERTEHKKQASIYGGLPFWSTRVAFIVGVGKTIRLNDTLVGTDKLGHFLSQGWKYHKRHLRGNSEERVVQLGVRNEKGIFGAASTGVFSNADLVANYEGYLFYRSLFEDDIVTGKTAIIRFAGARAVVQRPFDWRDHVNEYWDEALNPNRYSRNLGKHVARNLEQLCADFASDPAAYVPTVDPELEERYAHIGLRQAPAFRLDQVCDNDQISSTWTVRETQ